jgi:hypothetical protein
LLLLHCLITYTIFFALLNTVKQVDMQAIREKVCCQFVINKHNEKQVPMVKQFLAKHVIISATSFIYFYPQNLQCKTFLVIKFLKLTLIIFNNQAPHLIR